MDIRIEHAGRSITTFLEDDLSKAPLDSTALLHLERFRSFLLGFYVAKYGYWPPIRPKKRNNPYPKVLYTSMYFEFRKLYEYLVDPHASKSSAESQSTAGFSVFQVLEDFDKRSKYSPLPHCVPLNPEVPDTLSQKPQGLSKLFEKKQSRADRRTALLSALTAATNPVDLSTMDCALVREYLRFEKHCALDESERISCANARKVRWILIYGMLQTLISVTRAPTAVRDTEGVSYPLCCQIAGTPTWQVSKALPKSEPQTPKTPATAGEKNQEESTFYYFSKASVSFSSFKNQQTATTSPSEGPTPKAINEHSSRPPTRKRADPIEDYFSLKPNRVVSKPPSAPSIAALPTVAAPRFSISSVTVPLRSPQPRKPSLPEAFLALDLGESASSSKYFGSLVTSSSDPSTPSTGADESTEGDGWSVPGSDGDAMDHHSVDDATSVYEDGYGGNGESGGSGGCSGLVGRKLSVRSDFKFEKCNPEVEQYVGSG